MSVPGVVCVGHIAYDILFPLEAYPERDSKVMVSHTGESPGGPAYNAAALIASWGLPCSLAGVVGADQYGDRAIADFVALGGDASLVRRDGRVPTPLSIILSSISDGSRTIVTRKAPMEPLDGHALAAALPFVPSCILADGHEGEAAAVLAEAFPGAPFVLDAGSPRPGTERLVPSATHCIVSERYAASLLGKSRLGENEEVEEALRILARKARRSMAEAEGLCAVTLGARGCSYTGDGSSFSHLPAFHVPVVDSTGAGDIFHGAAAYALAVGLDGRSALTLASAAAALSVGKSGGFASIPSREDSEALSRRTGRQ